MLKFTLHKTDTSAKSARLGTLQTAHGEINTPCFMPVGTAGTVKAVKMESVQETGAQIILGNTYHLMMRPGADIVAHFGGLHKWTGWTGPILTDSGGFQVMSLSDLRKISEEGVEFKSHIDGGIKHFLSPEKSIEIQHQLDSNITMCFDECLALPCKYDDAVNSMHMTLRWAKRSKDAFINRDGYGIFGIVQGATFKDLRLESAMALTQIGFDGYAVGGLAVGEPQSVMIEVLSYTCPALPNDKPRYLMGVGKPDDIVLSVEQGIDMFDCILPTRSGRTGQAFTATGAINIKNAKWKLHDRPIDETCNCPTCKKYSAGYIHHLFSAQELLGYTLLSEHNLWFYQNLMRDIRNAITNDTFAEFKKKFFETYDTKRGE
ncbi:MAG: tRNA guanosine(34) transglycosylase Tgt [Rickettsiales bacterium]|jgi:queuine tRNA-ribosyltransferase|nr:tRNA guanosine(34) transglycosylase Tgt [Rickettsiales bacterium]